MVYIDSHAHLHMTPQEEIPKMIERAKKAGVQKIVNAACNLEQVGQCLSLVDQYKNIWTTAGIHPTDLTDNMEGDLKCVYTYAKNEKKIVAIGEIGLDYYHDSFPRNRQIDFLVGQLNIAKQLDLPAILHCRGGKNPGENEGAFVDLIAILTELRFSNAVVHCFSGNTVEAEKLIDIGMMISFTGLVTYPRNENIREIVKNLPLDRMMIETDSPFLSPDGCAEPNEPAFVVEVAKTIARVKGIDLNEVAEITTKNAERFFSLI